MGIIFPWLRTPDPDPEKADPSPPARPAPPPPENAGAASSRGSLIQAQDEARTRYKENQLGQTFCNDATFCIGQRMNTPLGPLANSRGVPYSANQMAQNLAVSTQYTEVTPKQAQAMANQGRVVLGAWFNPDGHGHMVTVRPEGVPGDQPAGNGGPVINDVGSFDRIARQNAAFPKDGQVFYYTPAAGVGH